MNFAWIDLDLNSTRNLWIPFGYSTIYHNNINIGVVNKIKINGWMSKLSCIHPCWLCELSIFMFFNICYKILIQFKVSHFIATHQQNQTEKISKNFIFTFLDCPRGFSIWGFKLNRNIHFGVRKIGQRKMC